LQQSFVVWGFIESGRIRLRYQTAAKANGQRVGYVRVSTLDQSTARQLEGVSVDTTFEDKASGKDVNRPELQAALKFVRKGDVLVVHSMDRLARNAEDLLRIVRELTGRGIAIEFVKEAQTFTGEDSPMAKAMLGMLATFAEFERSMIKERQREGIAIAKAAGKYKGRSASLSPTQAAEVKAKVAAEFQSPNSHANTACHVPPSTPRSRPHRAGQWSAVQV
jgi:DNA invertase Pin-like site-specific DNA recombinase